MSCCLVFLFFKGTHIPYSRNSRDLFSSLFAFFFGTSFLTTICINMSQKGSTKTAQNHKNLQKLIIKAHPQSRHAKRLRLEGVKPFKLSIVLHFQQSFQRPRAPKKESKWTENGATGHPKSQKSRKESTHKNIKKQL